MKYHLYYEKWSVLSFVWVQPPGGEGTPILYLYEYVPLNGVVILKLLI